MDYIFLPLPIRPFKFRKIKDAIEAAKFHNLALKLSICIENTYVVPAVLISYLIDGDKKICNFYSSRYQHVKNVFDFKLKIKLEAPKSQRILGLYV